MEEYSNCDSMQIPVDRDDMFSLEIMLKAQSSHELSFDYLTKKIRETNK